MHFHRNIHTDLQTPFLCKREEEPPETSGCSLTNFLGKLFCTLTFSPALMRKIK